VGVSPAGFGILPKQSLKTAVAEKFAMARCHRRQAMAPHPM
jgi:hypothetical protein